MKKWWTSRMIWANVISLVVGVLVVVSESELLKSNPELVAYLLMGVNVLNMILRAVTNKRLTM